jgi:hypothetical protein
MTDVGSSIIAAIIVVLIPAAAVVIVVRRAHSKRFWREVGIYFAGAFLGAVLFVELFAVLYDAAFPLVSSVYADWLDLQTSVLKRFFGRGVSHFGMWVTTFAVAVAPLYLGVAAGMWFVWRRRRKIHL